MLDRFNRIVPDAGTSAPPPVLQQQKNEYWQREEARYRALEEKLKKQKPSTTPSPQPMRALQTQGVSPTPSPSVLEAVKPSSTSATKTTTVSPTAHLPSERVDKAVETLDKPRQVADKALGSVVQKLEAKAVQEEAQGHSGRSLLLHIGASAAALAKGAATAVTSIISPKAWADTAKALTHPSKIAEAVKQNPLEISEIAGGVIGGLVLGKVLPSKPAVYETIPERTTVNVVLKHPDTILVKQQTTGKLVKIGESVAKTQPFNIEAGATRGGWSVSADFAGGRVKLPSGRTVKLPKDLGGSSVKAGGETGKVNVVRLTRTEAKPRGRFTETTYTMIKTGPDKLIGLHKQLQNLARAGKAQQAVSDFESMLQRIGRSKGPVSKDVLDVLKEPKQQPRIIRVPERVPEKPSPREPPAPKPSSSSATVLEQLHKTLEDVFKPKSRTVILEEKPQAPQLAGGVAGGLLGGLGGLGSSGSTSNVNIGGKHFPVKWSEPKPIEDVFNLGGGKHAPIPKPRININPEKLLNARGKDLTGGTGGKHAPILWHEPKPLEDLFPRQGGRQGVTPRPTPQPVPPLPKPVPIVEVVPKPVVRPIPKTRVEPEPKEEPEPKPPIPVPPQPIPVPVVTPKPVVTVTPKPKPKEEPKQDTGGGGSSPPPRVEFDWGFRVAPFRHSNPVNIFPAGKSSRYLYKEIVYKLFNPFKAIR